MQKTVEGFLTDDSGTHQKMLDLATILLTPRVDNEVLIMKH